MVYFKTKTENVCESEVITLDQDDPDRTRNPDPEGNKNMENLIREKVKPTVEELFQPIKTLLTENVVPDPAEAVHKKIDSKKAEDELVRSFERMRVLVDQMNFPEEMLNQFPVPEKSRKTSSLSPTKSEKSLASSLNTGSMYQCPKCDLKITKKQMRENENARHLQRHHKVDQKAYDRDRKSFHFIKVPLV